MCYRVVCERVEGACQRFFGVKEGVGTRQYQSSEVVTSGIDDSFFFLVLKITVDYPRGIHRLK